VGDILVCPKCQERLWVGEIQIPLVTCPKCLARVVNSNGAEDAGGESPQQVIPLESETSSDVRHTMRWVVVLAIALFGMGLFILLSAGNNVWSILMMAGGAIIAAMIPTLYRKSREVREPPRAHYYPTSERDGVALLEYANIRRERRANIGSFLGGFFLAMAISFATMILTGIGRQVAAGISVLLFVLGAGVLSWLAFTNAHDPQKRDFFNGLVAGIVLGAFGCGPCAIGAMLG
jgi:drug/metabolite transporter (DMT)-like permease